MSETMRIATGQFSEPTPDIMQFAAQMGVSGIVLNSRGSPVANVGKWRTWCGCASESRPTA